jgi:hypothetical protein
VEEFRQHPIKRNASPQPNLPCVQGSESEFCPYTGDVGDKFSANLDSSDSDYRHSQLRQLYSTAVSWSSDSFAAESAVRKLNSYRGAEPQDLLVKMVTADRDFLDDR